MPEIWIIFPIIGKKLKMVDFLFFFAIINEEFIPGMRQRMK